VHIYVLVTHCGEKVAPADFKAQPTPWCQIFAS